MPSATPLPVGWRLISDVDVVGEHIHVHELSQGGDLMSAIQEYREVHAKAVVLINTEDSYMLQLPEDVVAGLKGLGGFIVAVLCKSDGEKLLDCLQKQYDEEDIMAK